MCMAILNADSLAGTTHALENDMDVERTELCRRQWPIDELPQISTPQWMEPAVVGTRGSSAADDLGSGDPRWDAAKTGE